MPMTVNGVGTHYYGKRNRASRAGVCRLCGAQCQLESYDTRLWFVIFYIPVIPLGRKRIIDQCGRCMRHFAANQTAFEMSKQLNVSGALERYRSEPSAETALELHGCLLAFHQHEQAETFRKQALELHPADATLYSGLAEQLEQAGQWNSAAPLFEKALELRPDLPAARIGVATIRIFNNEVDQARELLRFLEIPGAGQLYPLGRLENLAQAYQRLGQHQETLELCGHLLREVPAVGQNYNFRKFVATSEKALGRAQSLLPNREFSIRSLFDAKHGAYASWQRWLAVGAVAAVLVLVGILAMNEHRRRHRTVFAMADCGQPVEVTIDNGTPVQVGLLTKLQLAEGQHHIKVAAPVNEEFDIAMGTGYFERWSKHPVWVLDVDGGTALMVSTVHYAAHPSPAEGRMLFGERCYYFDDIDYPFEEPPKKMQVPKGSGEVIKTHLDRSDLRPEQALRYAMQKGDIASAFDYAEARMRLARDNVALLQVYTQAAEDAEQTGRARQFLKAGLAVRPPSMAWHRAYQDLTLRAGQDAETAMIADYDALLKMEPHSASLLYLRGRLEGARGKAQVFYRRACDADATLGWPWMALARIAAAVGDWQQTRAMLDKAIAAKLEDQNVKSLRREALLETGDAAALEAECRHALKSGPSAEKPETLTVLCDALLAQGKAEEVRRLLAGWDSQFPLKDYAPDTVFTYRACVCYMLDDSAALRKIDTERLLRVAPELQLHISAVLAQPQEMVQNIALKRAHNAAWNSLTASLAFGLSGRAAEMVSWREKACAALRRNGPADRLAAAVLGQDKPPSQQQLDDLMLSPVCKTLVLASLGVRFPAEKKNFAKQMERLTKSHRPPYQLARKVLEDQRQGPVK
jgi:tetratricopeptide (TPR) repeat protein